jgi:hypothetical protein
MTSQQRNRVSRPGVLDRIGLALSTARYVDGLWVGSWLTPADLGRIEEALLLIKQHSRIHYSGVVRDLARIWVLLLPHRGGRYDESLGACMLDGRYVANATLEQIASTIVHEATHARLARCGIRYEENLRSRIEAVCIRRELAFVAKLPDGAELHGKTMRKLEWCSANTEWFSNEQLRERRRQGYIDALRYIEAPEWFIRIASRIGAVTARLRRLSRSTK